MSIDLVRENVFERFRLNYSKTEIGYENKKFTPVSGTAWVRISIQEADSNLAGLGSKRLFRNIGIISVQVFTAIGEGTKEANEIAESILGIFNGVSFDGITCRATSIDRVGETNGWYQLNATTPYYWDRQV